MAPMPDPVLQMAEARPANLPLTIKEAGDKILPSIHGLHNLFLLPQGPITEATAGII